MPLNSFIPLGDFLSKEVGKITKEVGIWGQSNAIRWE